MICVIHAHPYPSRSRVNRALADALRALPDLDLRSIYALYPDFDIDVAAEQKALAKAQLIVWLHPLYWYSVPALFKHWCDKVLEFGWAYGDGAHALHGKSCLWVADGGRRRGHLRAARDARHTRSRASLRRSSRRRASAECAGSLRTSCSRPTIWTPGSFRGT